MESASRWWIDGIGKRCTQMSVGHIQVRLGRQHISQIFLSLPISNYNGQHCKAPGISDITLFPFGSIKARDVVQCRLKIEVPGIGIERRVVE
jgi:hypothetical protein